MSSEKELADLKAQISTFEEQWKALKLKEKALIKKGVFNFNDSPEYDELRVERCVFYKPAKKTLRHLGMVVNYKIDVRNLFETFEVKSMTVAQIERGLEVSPNTKKPDMNQFVQALRELESNGEITIAREPGTASQVAKDAILNERQEIRFSIPTGPTPGHGYSNCVCGTCTVTEK